MAEGPPGLGWSIDWRPDGRLLVTGEALMRREPDGATVPHADLSGVATHGWNQIAVDGSLSNRRVWAAASARTASASTPRARSGLTPPTPGRTRAGTTARRAPCVRVREGGEVLARTELDRAGFACALGGPHGRTLFMLAADWRGVEQVEQAIADRTGQVLVAEAPAPGVGWP